MSVSLVRGKSEKIERKFKAERCSLGWEEKSEVKQEGIFFLIHLFARDVLVMKKLEIGKIKPIFIISVLKVEC